MGKSRRQRIYDNNRTEIIKAARIVFADKGYDKATISEIAAEADFSVGTIYNFFQSKKDLFEALVADQFTLIMAGIEGLTEKFPNPLHRLVESFDFVVELVEEQKDLMKIWFEISNFPFNDVHLCDSHLQMHKTVIKYTEGIFKEAIDQGYLENVNSGYISLAFHAMIDGFLYEYIVNPETNLREMMDTAKTLFFKSILTDKGRLEFQK